MAVAIVGLLPAIGSAGNGRWKLPSSGYGDALSFLVTPSVVGQRILWIGDPRSVPGSSWPIEPGLAWSTSTGGLPDTSDLFEPPSTPASGAITDALSEALDGRTSRLGQLLAPAGITAIVVTSAVAPTLPGLQTGVPTPPPAGVLSSLAQQRDLVEVPGGSGAVVFEDPRAMSIVSTRTLPLTSAQTSSSAASTTGWVPLSLETPLAGAVSSGSRGLFVGLAPSSAFAISGVTSEETAFGWARGATINASRVAVTLSVPPYDAVDQPGHDPGLDRPRPRAARSTPLAGLVVAGEGSRAATARRAGRRGPHMSAERRVRHRRSTSRGVVLVALVVALGGLAAISVATRQTASTSPPGPGASSVAPPGAESSAFTCGGLTEGGSSEGPGAILLTNATSAPVPARISVFDDAGGRKVISAVASPGETTSIYISGLLRGGTTVAADVMLGGGGVAVSERIGGWGSSVSACASTTSPTWYLVGGTTPEYASLKYVLVNPSATEAVVDVSFSTSGGLLQPQAAQGVVVRGGGVVVLQTNQIVPHQGVLAATVTATQGSVVAFASQQLPTPPSASVWLGSPSLSSRWFEPRAVATPGSSSSLVIDNPLPIAQVVTIHPTVVTGSLTAFTVSVAGNSVTDVLLSPEAHVPLTDVFSTEVTSTGPGVAVVQLTKAAHASVGGWNVVPLIVPSATTAGSWLLPGSPGGAPRGISLAAVAGDVRASISILTPQGPVVLSGLGAVQIAAGGLYEVPSSALAAIGRSPVLITSSGPLAIGEDQRGGASPGMATVGAIPVRS